MKTYTFLHRGVVMGFSDLSAHSNRGRQMGGVFGPTEYGCTLLPRLTRMYSFILSIQKKLAPLDRKFPKKRWTPEEMDAWMYESEEGRGIIDVGRVLSEVELIGSDGQLIHFKSVGFSNVEELRRTARELNFSGHDQLPDLPPGSPEFFVSVTLAPPPSPKMRRDAAVRSRLVQ